jgi:histidinol dehydrogenase
MIRRIDLGRQPCDAGLARPDYRTLVPRADFDVEAALQVVRPICDDVRDRGVEAIAEYSERFDGVTRPTSRCRARPARGPGGLDPGPGGLEESIRRLRITCEAELEADTVTDSARGTGHQRLVPVDRVGLYVPGASRRWSRAC